MKVSSINNFSLIALLLFFCLAPGTVAMAATAQNINFTKINPMDYQNFLGNWDDSHFPVLYAQIQSAKRYETLFHPAPVMGKNRPFGPESTFFTTNQLLVIGRVMPMSDQLDKLFEVVKISEINQELSVSYRYNPPQKAASSTIKYYLGISIPQKTYSKITFIENGKTVGTLPGVKGAWSVPTVP